LDESQRGPDEPEGQKRLSDESYWNVVYRADRTLAALRASRTSALKRWYRWMWGHETVFGRTLSGYVTDEIILRPHFPIRADWKVLEVGSAPGQHLVQMHKRFAYEPFGVEYTPDGAEVNRRVFREHGLDPANVIQLDFLDPEFQDAYRESFDVVYSRGLIEHFESAADIVEKHVALLKDGGLLLISIPNLRGLNNWLAKFFYSDVLAIHNLSIMERSRFQALFDGLPVRPLYCDYLGVFALGLQATREGSWKRQLLAKGIMVEAMVGLAARPLLGNRHPESRWTSPYLVFLGEKVPATSQGRSSSP
jgi:SAM-dependent methyltransferase